MLCYVTMLCTSGFVDEVHIFPYYAGNRPESKTTRTYRPVHQMAAPIGRQTPLFGRDRHVAAPGGEVCPVSDYILFCYSCGLSITAL